MLLKLYFATNRRHEGKNRWSPTSYGKKFSSDGMENLRFGCLTLEASEKKISKYLAMPVEDCGKGDGVGLSEYLSKCAKKAKIDAFEESSEKDMLAKAKKKQKFGSQVMFANLKSYMEEFSDVLVYIHGFNVSWYAAVGAALSLQIMLQSKRNEGCQDVVVVLFSWPSDGMALPWISYKADRRDVRGSGAAVGRALLKTRDFLAGLQDRAAHSGHELCGREIHLLCHSMGNFLLENVLSKLSIFTSDSTLPRIFANIFLCAPDVNDTALEAGQPLEKINQIARNVTLYHNRGDVAMVVSDYTKGQPERLGGAGAAHPVLLHNKVHQVDCTNVVHGLVEHSYYLAGNIVSDIRFSIDGKDQFYEARKRTPSGTQKNIWAMTP